METRGEEGWKASEKDSKTDTSEKEVYDGLAEAWDWDWDWDCTVCGTIETGYWLVLVRNA